MRGCKNTSRFNRTPAGERIADLVVGVPQEDVHRVPNGGLVAPFARSQCENVGCALGRALGWRIGTTKGGACRPHL